MLDKKTSVAPFVIGYRIFAEYRDGLTTVNIGVSSGVRPYFAAQHLPLEQSDESSARFATVVGSSAPCTCTQHGHVILQLPTLSLQHETLAHHDE